MPTSNDKNDRDEMMDVAVKSSILVITTIVSFVIFEGYWTLCLLHTKYVNSQRFIIAEHLLALDCIINQICLMLQFKFMNKHYYFLCRICHQACFNCCSNDNDKHNNGDDTKPTQKATRMISLPSTSPTPSSNPSIV